MADELIQFFNRYTQRIEVESVYGHGFLKFSYGNPLGRLALHAMVKRSAFSRWYGWRMDRPASRAKVRPFIDSFGVDVSEFAEDPESYRTFNEFFYRTLKPEARPVAAGDGVAVFPADGRHLGFQDVSKAEGVFVKGHMFDLRTLMQSDELAERYREGSMILSRLCPVDYHRFHFPVAGVAGKPVLIDGPLYSVNPIALRRNIHIFTENKRAWCEIESEQFGRVLMFEVGATCVGSFEYTFAPGQRVAKGLEKGYFKFGGSSTITFFERGRVRLDEDLAEQSRRGVELYARMGDRMGSAVR